PVWPRKAAARSVQRDRRTPDGTGRRRAAGGGPDVLHRTTRLVCTLVVALLATATGAGFGLRPANATGSPTLDINSATIQEGDGGVGSLQFTVTLSNPPTNGTSAT